LPSWGEAARGLDRLVPRLGVVEGERPADDFDALVERLLRSEHRTQRAQPLAALRRRALVVDRDGTLGERARLGVVTLPRAPLAPSRKARRRAGGRPVRAAR